MRLAIKVHGMDAPSGILEAIPERIIPLAAAGLARGLDGVAEEAAALVPVRSGELRQSIGVGGPVISGNSVSGSVTASKEYAVFVETGTGGPGGQAARPFMYPAYMAKQEAVIQSVADSLREGMSG